jgi:hypothetical protein
VVIDSWDFAMMDDVSRQLRGKGTLKEASVDAIPEDLIKDALVVGGIEGKVPV